MSRNADASPSLPPQADGWVAVVDDDASIRRSLGRFFQANDIQVETFGCPEAFRRRANAGEPCCVVLDIGLAAALNGYDARGAAIIFMTGFDARAPGRLAHCARASSFLRKPFDPGELMSLVRQHLPESTEKTA